jgi:hypothetical protein
MQPKVSPFYSLGLDIAKGPFDGERMFWKTRENAAVTPVETPKPPQTPAAPPTETPRRSGLIVIDPDAPDPAALKAAHSVIGRYNGRRGGRPRKHPLPKAQAADAAATAPPRPAPEPAPRA